MIVSVILPTIPRICSAVCLVEKFKKPARPHIVLRVIRENGKVRSEAGAPSFLDGGVRLAADLHRQWLQVHPSEHV